MKILNMFLYCHSINAKGQYKEKNIKCVFATAL